MTNKLTRNDIAIWTLRGLMAALFLFACSGKLLGQPMMVDEFEQVGLGQWLRYLTGMLELIGGVAILIPPVSAFAALLLLAIDIGAFFAQILVLHMDWIHTIIIGLMLAALVYLQRDRLSKLPV
jgi:uncharacterized membrane protein YphA (DoxX/SURF4 family)